MTKKTFTIKTIKHFSAAHVIPGHPGACARLHGHNFRVEVEVRGHKLNEIGMVIDFYDIKTALKVLIDKLDHRYINEIPPFDKIIPTSENLAAWFYRELKNNLPAFEAKLVGVSVWESENNGVHYTEDEG